MPRFRNTQFIFLNITSLWVLIEWVTNVFLTKMEVIQKITGVKFVACHFEKLQFSLCLDLFLCLKNVAIQLKLHRIRGNFEGRRLEVDLLTFTYFLSEL